MKEKLKPYLPKEIDLSLFEISQGEIDENGKCKIQVKINDILRVFEIKSDNSYQTVAKLILKELMNEDLCFFNEIIRNKNYKVKIGKYYWEVLRISKYEQGILLLCSDKVAVRKFCDSDRENLYG